MSEQATVTAEAPMDTETLEALRGSIRKWERVVAEGTDGTLWKDCPLCLMFWDDDCHGCPVMKATGMSACRGSPFAAYDDARESYFATVDGAHVGSDPAVVAAAQAELDFLKSLLPAGVTA
jgi:hypothetical protein